MGTVSIYTDGCCLKNPGGKGGYASITKYPSGTIDEYFGGFRSTTNNRMEIMAAVIALEKLKAWSGAVVVYSDSQYVVSGAMKWINGWRKRQWRTAAGQAVKNRDLWERLLLAMAGVEVRFCWVRGHDGHPENERCDYLAGRGALAANHGDDAGYAE